MKIFFSLSLIVLFLIGCSEAEEGISPFQQAKFRKIAYASLSVQEAATLTNDWKTAPVKIGIYKNDNGTNTIIIDGNNRWGFGIYDQNITLTPNQILIAVTFNTSNDPLIGPLTLIIEPQSENVIGGVLRF